MTPMVLGVLPFAVSGASFHLLPVMLRNDLPSQAALWVALPLLGGGFLVAAGLGAGVAPLVWTGAVLVTASVDITTGDPQLATCQEWLALYQAQFTVGPTNQGIADPITATVPINGVTYRYNGNTMPRSPEYRRHLEEGFASWRLTVDGLVERPRSWSLAELKALPARSQITRHDCVEGWSAIGKWTGPKLGDLLGAARLRPEARYIVLHCADDFAVGLSRAGYYVWQQHQPSVHSEQDRKLLSRIQAVYAASEGTYGSPRIYGVLQQAGIAVSRKRVARLMREAGLRK